MLYIIFIYGLSLQHARVPGQKWRLHVVWRSKLTQGHTSKTDACRGNLRKRKELSRQWSHLDHQVSPVLILSFFYSFSGYDVIFFYFLHLGNIISRSVRLSKILYWQIFDTVRLKAGWTTPLTVMCFPRILKVVFFTFFSVTSCGSRCQIQIPTESRSYSLRWVLCY